MAKQHRDFVIYVRNSVDINALVARSREIIVPATQTEPESRVEHLTLVYLDPLAAGAGVLSTGEQLRNSIAIAYDVLPVGGGRLSGWKEVGSDGSGSERWGGGDWTTAGQDKEGFPVASGSAEDVTQFGAMQRDLARKNELLTQDADLIAEFKSAGTVENDPAVAKARKSQKAQTP